MMASFTELFSEISYWKKKNLVGVGAGTLLGGREAGRSLGAQGQPGH